MRRLISARWTPGQPISRGCCWSNSRWSTATTGSSFRSNWRSDRCVRLDSLVITDTFGVRTLIKSNSESGDAAFALADVPAFTHAWKRIAKPGAKSVLPPAVADYGIWKASQSRRCYSCATRWRTWPGRSSGCREPDGTAAQPLRSIPGTATTAEQQSPRRYRRRRERCVTGCRPKFLITGSRCCRWSGRRAASRVVAQCSRLMVQRRHVHPLGRILETGHALSFYEEEVPREGVRVTRSYQFTRWIDGSSHLWIGRRKGVGTRRRIERAAVRLPRAIA